MKKHLNTLDDWLSWQQTLHPKNIDFKLERIKSVYKKLNIGKIADKIITIAGTNGKGSTVAFLESILFENNLQIGSFTSPHITNYNERIKINKKEIDTESILNAFEIINDARGEITLTYFEFATLSAFYLFSKSDLDYAILEVGLGGRLDATNIIDSDLSIITSIGIDHTEFLGTTIDSIALEKAGVMRSFCPCIFADTSPPSVLFSYARKKATNFIYNSNDFFVNIINDSWSWKSNNNQINGLPELPLVGDFQYNHAAAAITAINLLDQSLLDNIDSLHKGLSNVELLGRFQKISSKPEIILDVAHNADSANKLQLNLMKKPKSKTIAIFGVLKDKDVYSLIKPLSGIIDHWYCVTIDSERGMNATEIKSRMSSIIDKDSISIYPDMTSAINDAIASLDSTERLIVYGSFYTVSEFIDITKDAKQINVKAHK